MSRYQFRVLFFPAFCLLCISINSSCVRDNDNTMSFDGFSNVEMIEGAIEKCPAVIIDPTRMFILDDFLFVLQKKANQLVTIIDLNANALSLQFGLQGSGPGEFSNVNSNYFLKYNDPEPGFTIGNRGNQLQFYKLKDLLKGNDTEYKIESIIPKAMRLRAGALFSDTTLWGASYMPNVDIFKLHFENGGFEPVMDYPLDFPLLSTA
ncbi:MAG: hypothetical protein U9N86_01385 [Bacteroidota bacterium]|nr:hypothetical protein [Bacteroidota bacterium]